MENSSLKDIINNSSDSPLNKLKKSIATYDKELAIISFNELIKEKFSPVLILEKISEVMRLIGKAYENDELYLPDLIGASDTMSAVLPLAEAEIIKSGEKIHSPGAVVLGTVLGDIHTIGKQMVGTLLRAEGFTVYDIGVDVSAEKFVSAIKAYNADILAMSALLTTTAYEQKKVISILQEEELRDKVKVMVGGGAVTEEFACSIGADGYDPTAPGAAKLALKLLNK
ncbi:MAG: cobalamin-binding protein [Actinobacteria bacterium]|nr:cobalamin-binding protein [Actinomycetota bacterium]